MARRWVNHLSDLGGTDINGALEQALKLKGGQAMDILLLTDGQDWEVGESVAKAKTEEVRIFTMGIGSAVAEEAVQMMADETGGACELVTPTEDMSERIYRHFNRMRQPQMSKLEITWPGAPLWECRPSRACFAGDAYTVFSALPNDIAQEASVRFEFAAQGPQSLTVPLRTEDTCSESIVRLGARQRLANMDEAQRQSWAVAYQLITKETDYLITVERSADEKATDLPALQTQPQMLPAGWGGTSSVQATVKVASARRHTSRSNRMMFSIPAPPDLDRSGQIPTVVRKRNVTVEGLEQLSSNGYNKFIEKFNQMSTRNPQTRIPTTIDQLIKLPAPRALAELIATMISEGISNDVLIHSFYSALMLHSGNSSLNIELVTKLLEFLNNEHAVAVVVDRIRDKLDELWDKKSSGLDRYDIPAFLRRAAD